VRFLRFLENVFSKTTRRICVNFFQDLGKNTCSLQPALKTLHLAFNVKNKAKQIDTLCHSSFKLVLKRPLQPHDALSVFTVHLHKFLVGVINNKYLHPLCNNEITLSLVVFTLLTVYHSRK